MAWLGRLWRASLGALQPERFELADRPTDLAEGLTSVEPAVPASIPEPEPIVIETEIVEAPAPGLLNDGERKRIDLAMAGLSRFGPVADPIRPAPRMEVDSLSSVSAADWSGMDGMGEEIADSPRFEPTPALAPISNRREPVAAPVLEAVSPPTSDPIKGWVTADRLFSDFGD